MPPARNDRSCAVAGRREPPPSRPHPFLISCAITSMIGPGGSSHLRISVSEMGGSSLFASSGPTPWRIGNILRPPPNMAPSSVRPQPLPRYPLLTTATPCLARARPSLIFCGRLSPISTADWSHHTLTPRSSRPSASGRATLSIVSCEYDRNTSWVCPTAAVGLVPPRPPGPGAPDGSAPAASPPGAPVAPLAASKHARSAEPFDDRRRSSRFSTRRRYSRSFPSKRPSSAFAKTTRSSTARSSKSHRFRISWFQSASSAPDSRLSTECAYAARRSARDGSSSIFSASAHTRRYSAFRSSSSATRSPP